MSPLRFAGDDVAAEFGAGCVRVPGDDPCLWLNVPVAEAYAKAAAVEVGGASVLFAMTSVGDGFFPVRVEQDASGAPVAMRVTIQDDDE